MDIPLDVLKLIASYIAKHKMKLLDWIVFERLKKNYTSLNPNAIDILEEHPHNIIWEKLSNNPNAIKYWKPIQIRYIGLNYQQTQMQFIYWKPIQII
jgi:hypothetical protein